jgi:hypothetical protein
LEIKPSRAMLAKAIRLINLSLAFIFKFDKLSIFFCCFNVPPQWAKEKPWLINQRDLGRSRQNSIRFVLNYQLSISIKGSNTGPPTICSIYFPSFPPINAVVS